MNEKTDVNENFEASLSMGAGEFQKSTGRINSDYDEKREQQINKYIDDGTGIIYKDISEYRKCPVCGGEGNKKVFVKEGFQYVKCSHCDMFYQNPILDEKNYDKFYNDSYASKYWMKVLLSPIQFEFDMKKFNYGLDIVEKTIAKNRNIQEGQLQGLKALDVGCGVGTFLKAAKLRGWDEYGVELNKDEAEYCMSEGLKVRNEYLDKSLYDKESFDLITLWDVIEHIADPREMLSTIEYLLKKDGILLILTPNVKSMAATILHEKCNMFGAGHVNMFENKTINKILKNNGYNILHFETVISELNVIANYLNYEDAYEGNIKGHKLFGNVDEKYILDTEQGYKILALAQKIDG